MGSLKNWNDLATKQQLCRQVHCPSPPGRFFTPLSGTIRAVWRKGGSVNVHSRHVQISKAKSKGRIFYSIFFFSDRTLITGSGDHLAFAGTNFHVAPSPGRTSFLTMDAPWILSSSTSPKGTRDEAAWPSPLTTHTVLISDFPAPPFFTYQQKKDGFLSLSSLL